MDTIIIYSSMTGTTELMAETISKELTKTGAKVAIKDAFGAFADELKNYDRILIGSYTWGDGDVPDELLDFYDELCQEDLSGKQAAVFGAGDSSYTYFARAVDIFEEALVGCGCKILTASLKVDGEPEEKIRELCKAFSKEI